MATVYLLPDSEGSVQDWGVFPARVPVVHWDKVNDDVGDPDEDDTYVFADATGEIEEFNHQTSDLLTGVVITKVRVTARMKFTGAPGGSDVNIGLKVAGTRYPAAVDTALTSSYVNYTKDWTNNPDDIDPWEKSDIDNIQTSLDATTLWGMGVTFRCTQIYLTVSYIPINPLIGKSLVRHDIINKAIIR